MTEVTLVKRLIVIALIALTAIGTVACTRDKPEELSPTVVAASGPTSIPSLTPSLTTPIPAGTSGTPVPVASTQPVTATVAVSPTIVIATLVPSTTTPTPTMVSTSAPGTYTVQWGDWLNKIAGQFGVSPQAILAANPGLNPNLIYPGQVIKIPSVNEPSPTTAPANPPATNPGTYTVQRGDWFYAIARKFNITVPALLAANPGVNPNFVYPGQVLNIPGGDSPATPPSPSPSAGTYTVQRGDTLFSIAVRFRTTTYALQIKNNLANPNFIYPGQVLTIPQ